MKEQDIIRGLKNEGGKFIRQNYDKMTKEQLKNLIDYIFDDPEFDRYDTREKKINDIIEFLVEAYNYEYYNEDYQE